jgi:outer membrane protein assembly factor BamB
MTALRRAAALGTLTVLAACAHTRAPVNADAQWLMYQGSASHNAVIAHAGAQKSWFFNAGGQINGGLAVAGDVLYVDTLAGDLYALDMRDLHVFWHVKRNHALMSTPVLWHGLLYVGSGSNKLLTKKPSPWGTGDSLMGVPAGDAIYAFDAASGAQRWSFPTVGEDMPSPAIADGLLIFANGDFHAYALDAQTGALRWKRKLDGIATMASATVANGRALISFCNYHFPYRCETDALDPRTGRIEWSAPYGNADASPTYGNGTIFLSGLEYVREGWEQVARAHAVIAALDAANGRVKWRYRDPQPSIPNDVGSSERAIAGTYADGKYFQAVPGRGQVLAFDARTGRVVWRFQALSPVKMSPVYAAGRLYFGGVAGIMYALDATTGTLVRIHTFRQPFTSSPPLVIGRTIVTARNQAVEALPLTWFDPNADVGTSM